MNYGYARVSTTKQGYGNSLEEQLGALFSAGCEEIFEERFTAKHNDRPKLKEVLAKLESGDTFTVTKIDRFARSLISGSKLVEDLISKGIIVNILNIGIMDNSPSRKLIRNIFLSFAEFERDMIIERTSEGKAIAKTKEGFKEGRPKKFDEKLVEYAISLLTVNGGECSYKEVETITGISSSTLKRENLKRKTIT
ncbi:MAG: recombinase family protein [Clostridium sp.]